LRNAHLLRQFLAVATEGSLSAAAAALAMTQPALTKNIQKLEREAGARLFERLPRGVALTAFGRVLLVHARRVEAECRAADLRLAAVRRARPAVLRVGAGLMFSTAIVPNAVVALQRRYPDVGIELVSAITEDNFPRLVAGELDLIFGQLPPAASISGDLVCRPMVALAMHIVADASHPLAGRPSVQAADLLEYPWVVIQRDRDQIAALGAALAKETGRAPDVRIEVTSLSSLAGVLKSGNYLGTFSKTVPELGVVVVRYCRPLPIFEAGGIHHRALQRYAPAMVLVDLVRAATRLAGSGSEDGERLARSTR
jgi:DNA-binding transcriptional LysR family regulator